MENRVEKNELDEYRIRTYEPGDDEEIVGLHNSVWRGERTLEWFEWKYVNGPYADGVPVFVVTHDGAVVGAFGLLPFRMRAGDETGIGALAGDLVVHPDHRGRGVFSALLGPLGSGGTVETEHGTISIRDHPAVPGGIDFLFAYSNPLSHPGLRKLGWVDIAPRLTYYRIHDPTSFVRDRLGGAAARVAGPLARAGTRTWLRARTTSTDRADLTVEFHEGVPMEPLTTLARRGSPSTVHAVYDEAFYEWRFTGVTWTQDGTYVARRGEEPVAAVIVRERHDERLDATTLSLVHTVPLAGREHEAGIAAVLDRLVAERSDVDFLRAWNPVFPDRLLRERGFIPDDRPPLSWTGDPDLRLVARSLSGPPFSDAALAESGATLWAIDK